MFPFVKVAIENLEVCVGVKGRVAEREEKSVNGKNAIQFYFYKNV